MSTRVTGVRVASQADLRSLDIEFEDAVNFVRMRKRTDTRTEAECWPVSGARFAEGYGAVHWRGRRTTASRMALEWKLGRPLREGYYACHTCDTPECVNPEHLYEGTASENAADMVRAGRNFIRSAINEDTVRSIRERASDGESYGSIAARFGISRSSVGYIVRRERWSHVQ